MDAVSSLLYIMAAFQALVSLLLLGPQAIALPVAQLVKHRPKASAAQAVVYTVAVALTGILAFSIFQLMTDNDIDRMERRDTRGDVLTTIDKLRAQVLCCLSAANLVLLFVLRCLGQYMALYDWSTKNLEAMKRQVKGLQDEYNRVTAVGGVAPPAGPASSKEEELKRAVEQLQKEKAALTASVTEGEQRVKSAEAKTTALESQWKGFEREYDRVLAESQQLQQQLQALSLGGGAPCGSVGKKDE